MQQSDLICFSHIACYHSCQKFCLVNPPGIGSHIRSQLFCPGTHMNMTPGYLGATSKNSISEVVAVTKDQLISIISILLIIWDALSPEALSPLGKIYIRQLLCHFHAAYVPLEDPAMISNGACIEQGHL